jgi:hypothetical protein
MATMVQAVRLALHYGETHLGVTDIFGEDVGPPLGGIVGSIQLDEVSSRMRAVWSFREINHEIKAIQQEERCLAKEANAEMEAAS